MSIVHMCTHENDDKPGLNKSRHGLGDVVTEHIGAPPDVPLEVADGVTLVTHLKLRSAILDPGLFCFDKSNLSTGTIPGQVTEGVPDSGGPVRALQPPHGVGVKALAFHFHRQVTRLKCILLASHFGRFIRRILRKCFGSNWFT